ncbi:hypothetical protein Syun_006732 [Stephania yunnanensis]|uniref:HhH-GPD domain-containing protein n=1 Tax=Stephania yunnanensis TaxID=152371 RepID=A0AAP0Q1N1_9MAGN
MESSSFDFEKVVCSHGFFMMAPNLWDPINRILRRPLRLLSDPTTIVTVQISHHDPSSLLVQVLDTNISTTFSLSQEDQNHLLSQVARMLRISETEEKKVREFHRMHHEAKNRGFSRVFRSPTLFEDMVKSILLCNCRSLDMAKALCDLQLEMRTNNSTDLLKSSSAATSGKRKRKYSSTKEGASEAQVGDFPSFKELAGVDHQFLQIRCNLGYRALSIVGLAQKIAKSKGKWLHGLEKAEKTILEGDTTICDNVYEKLMRIKGFGSFASSYVLTCMGNYQRIPADSETIRHLNKLHGRRCSKETLRRHVEDVYKKFAPFQFLAYWSELWEFYEKEFGNLSTLEPSKYKTISGSFPNKGK